jgi:signal transduction histidine kinase
MGDGRSDAGGRDRVPPVAPVAPGLVDRRFSRARYEALRRVEGFLEELRAGRAEPESIEPLLRELLADPSLELRFYVPESETYVTAAGAPTVDVRGDARVFTPIERAGLPVAVVLHRATGPQSPDPLVTLVEAGGLAIEIARLRVQLRRQLAEVEASRARIVVAGYAERRRIERDLHGGAQQRLSRLDSSSATPSTSPPVWRPSRRAARSSGPCRS